VVKVEFNDCFVLFTKEVVPVICKHCVKGCLYYNCLLDDLCRGDLA